MRRIILIFIIVIAAVLSASAAEDITEVTPDRLGPAIGVSSTPFSFGYRYSMARHQSFDFMLHIPEYINQENYGAGIELGFGLGYNIPLRIEENIAFVVKPQLDFAYAFQSADDQDTKRKVFSLYPGAFAGLEIFLEEVGVPDVNIAIGFSTGMEYSNTTVETGETESSSSSFRLPMNRAPHGATVALWWYF